MAVKIKGKTLKSILNAGISIAGEDVRRGKKITALDREGGNNLGHSRGAYQSGYHSFKETKGLISED